jgi:hypothetical protein
MIDILEKLISPTVAALPAGLGQSGPCEPRPLVALCLVSGNVFWRFGCATCGAVWGDQFDAALGTPAVANARIDAVASFTEAALAGCPGLSDQ